MRPPMRSPVGAPLGTFEDWAAREAGVAQQRAAQAADQAQHKVDELMAAQERAEREEAEAKRRVADQIAARSRAAQLAIAAQERATQEAVVAQQRVAKLMADQERAARAEMEAQQRATQLMEAQDKAAQEAAEAQERAAHEAMVAKLRAAQMMEQQQRAAGEEQASQQRAAQRLAIQQAIALQQRATQEALAAQQVAAQLIANHEQQARQALNHQQPLHVVPTVPAQLGPPNPAIDAPRVVDNLVDNDLELQRQAEFNSWKEALRRKKTGKLQMAPTRATYLTPNPDGSLPPSPYAAAVHPTLSEFEQLMDAARATAVPLPQSTHPAHGQVRKRETSAPTTIPTPPAVGSSPLPKDSPRRDPTPLPTDPTPESSIATLPKDNDDLETIPVTPSSPIRAPERAVDTHGMARSSETSPISNSTSRPEDVPHRVHVPTPLWPRDPYSTGTTATSTTSMPPAHAAGHSSGVMFAPGHTHDPYWPTKSKTPKKYEPPQQGEVTSAWPFQNATNEDDDLDMPPALAAFLSPPEVRPLPHSAHHSGSPPPPAPGPDSSSPLPLARPTMLARLLTAASPQLEPLEPLEPALAAQQDNESLLRRARQCERERRGCQGLSHTWNCLQALVTPRATPRAALARVKRGGGLDWAPDSFLHSRGMAASQLETHCALFGG